MKTNWKELSETKTLSYIRDPKPMIMCKSLNIHMSFIIFQNFLFDMNCYGHHAK